MHVSHTKLDHSDILVLNKVQPWSVLGEALYLHFIQSIIIGFTSCKIQKSSMSLGMVLRNSYYWKYP